MQLAKALAKIGDLLPRTKVNAELYQTQNMKEAVSRLYAHIILFFQQAVRWYSMGVLSRTMSSILNPFELDYKDTLEEVRVCSETVNEIANTAARAEVRDIHIIVQLQERRLCEMQTEMKEMQQQIHSQLGQVLQVSTSKVPLVFRWLLV